MSQHDEFVEGFKAATGLEDPQEIEMAVSEWAAELSAPEIIDIQSGGYLAGLEAGAQWRKGDSA